jgi:hypothetical protein
MALSLIRDNEQIYPTEFLDISLVPPRLPDVLEPRILSGTLR